MDYDRYDAAYDSQKPAQHADCRSGDCAACEAEQMADEQDAREYPCECCDTDEQHDAAMAAQMRDFLRDPGPAPKRFTEEQVARAQRGIDLARKAVR